MPETSSFVDDLRWRGLLYDQTDGLDALLAEHDEPVTAYCGFDPTADSLHVGSLVPLMNLARLQRAGHRPIALMGGGTGLIGDPSGKSAERTLLSEVDIQANLAGLRPQLERFLDFDAGDRSAEIVNNADWLATIPLTTFLRDVGKHFGVGAMMAKESVRRRLERESGLSYTEFSYQLLQAYDFVVLYDRLGCRVQLGGSDQWGNITAGTDLVRRLRGERAFGVVSPLVTTAAGTKFGKTEAGTVWLDPVRTSPYRFYQFWLRTDDRDAGRYLRYFTWLGQEEIEALEAEHEEAPYRRVAQQRLAEEVTRLVHGQDALDRAQQASEALFGGDLAGLDLATIEEIFEDVPSATLSKEQFEGEGLSVVDLAAEAGLSSSKGEARRLAKQGGLYVNGERVEGADDTVTMAQSLEGKAFVLRQGKKKYALVRVE